MTQIDNLSNDADQVTTVILDDGSKVTITLLYLPAIQRWSLDVTYGNFTVLGLNLCIHANILRGWRNLIPFGIMCSTIDGADPIYIDDFSSGRASLFVLNSDDVLDIESTVNS